MGLLALLCAAAWLASFWIAHTTLWNSLGYVFFAAWIALGFLKPEKRAQRYEIAFFALKAAIARFEGDPDVPDSVLGEADRRAYEALHVKRIRTAPAWIRSKRRGYRLRILRWLSPALLPVVLPAVALLLGWRWLLRPWHAVFVVAAFILLFVGATYGTRKLVGARGILSEAIERYEYESAAAESDLEEADRRASEVLLN